MFEFGIATAEEINGSLSLTLATECLCFFGEATTELGFVLQFAIEFNQLIPMLDFAIALSGLLVSAGEVFEDDRKAGMILGLLIVFEGAFPGLNGFGIVARSILLNAVLDLLFGGLCLGGRCDRDGDQANEEGGGEMHPRLHGNWEGE